MLNPQSFEIIWRFHLAKMASNSNSIGSKVEISFPLRKPVVCSPFTAKMLASARSPLELCLLWLLRAAGSSFFLVLSQPTRSRLVTQHLNWKRFLLEDEKNYRTETLVIQQPFEVSIICWPHFKGWGRTVLFFSYLWANMRCKFLRGHVSPMFPATFFFLRCVCARMSVHAAHFPVAAIDLALCRGPVVIAALSHRPAMISRGKWGGKKSFLSSISHLIGEGGGLGGGQLWLTVLCTL